jgi:2-phospho-L-lactate guanylyltransferase
MILAVIPVKCLNQAKSRLAPHLTEIERADLARTMAARVAWAVRDSRVVDVAAVVSPESNLARDLGVEALPDRGSLNESLREGVAWATKMAATSLLILPADLPWIVPQDVREIVEAAVDTPGIVIAPTRDGGTGALMLTPPGVLLPVFGHDSFRRHVSLAASLGIRVRPVSRDGLAFDLDTVDDLAIVQACLGR